MLVIHHRLPPQPYWDEELHLTFDARSKSRLRCFSAAGEDVGLFLERGQPPLHDGDWARSTLEVCLALLESAGSGKDVELLR